MWQRMPNGIEFLQDARQKDPAMLTQLFGDRIEPQME